MSADDRYDFDALSDEDRAVLARLLAEVPAGADRIAPREPGAPAPLSFSQQRLWVVDQLEHAGSAYNLWVAFRVRGPLRVSTLADAFSEIVRRHEALRTTFHVENDQPSQRVEPSQPFRIAETDLRATAADQREGRAKDAALAEILTPFDLSTGPLLRARVLWLDRDDCVLVVTLHHIVTDGWSMGLLHRELAALYRAGCEGRRSPLADLSIQYADFASWQRQRLTGPHRDALIAYWRTQLEGAPETDLPLDAVRPPTPSARGAHELVPLDGALVRAVDELARREGATRYMVLVGAFFLLLSRYTGETDLVVGMPVAGRDRQELEPLIGFFVNTLPLRVQVPARATFRELVRSVRTQALAAFERQELPFDLLIDALDVDRTLDRHPVFQCTFSAQDRVQSPLELPDLQVSPFDLPSVTTRFDLEAHVMETGGAPAVGFVYRTDLFRPATVRRMLEQYVGLLESCAGDPDRPVSAAALLTTVDRTRVVEAWNATAAEYPRDETVPGLVARQAAARPDATAVSCAGRALTYRELDERGTRLAHRLRRLGVRCGVRVGVCLERSPETVVALLAVLKAGGAYVPLDPAYPAERLLYMADDSQVEVAVTSSDLAPLLPARVGRVVCLDRDADGLRAESAAPLPGSLSPDDLAYVIYTSGSTGRPKGVEIVHRAVIRLVCGTDYARFDASETFLHLAPLSFDASTFEIWGPLIHGGRLVLYPDRLPQLDELADVLRRERVTTLWLTASLYNTVIDQVPEALAGLRQLLIGGEALSVAHVRRGLAALPATRIINGYGPTESTTFACCYPIPPEAVPDGTVSIPIGRPIANTRAYVLDRDFQPVPAGIPGELWLGGDGLARGYTGAPRLTASRFVPDPFAHSPGGRLYRTGDRVRWREDGLLEFLGRRDDQVKVRGHRIELGEIEHALRQHPGVRQAVVAVRQHETGSRHLAAWVVARPNATLEPDELRTFLKLRLPEYMVPAVIVPMAALPLTANGKIDRAALPEPSRIAELSTDDRTPRTAVEATLAGIWADALGVGRVGIHDNFFDLGGDSILAIQIASRAQRAGLALTPRHFFECQTVAEQAALSGQAELRTADQGAVTGEVPPTPIQRWFFEQALSEPDHFNQAVLLELRDPAEPAAVQRALDALLAHHDALRSRFVRAGSDWTQIVDPVGPPASLTHVDVSGRSEADATTLVEARCGELQAALDLSRGPVLRAALFTRLPHGGDRLFLVAHHLVVDGVSWRIMLEDLQTAFAQLRGGGHVRLPPKTTSAGRWAEDVQAHAASPALESDLAFWRQHLSAAAAALPVDSPGPPDRNTVGSSATVSMRLPPALTEALVKDLPRALGLKIEEVLLASLACALARWSGSATVCVDVEGHGRTSPGSVADVSRTVGWFTSIHPALLRAPIDVEPIQAATDVADQLRAVTRHGSAYGILRYLVDDAGVRREMASAHPEVSFNYLGRFDHVVSETGPFGLAAEPVGPSVGPRNRRRHLLEFNARIVDGTLQIDWTFSRSVHEPSTIERVAAESADLVRQIADLAREAPPSRPSARDFPLAALDDRQLQAVMDRYGSLGVEDVLVLAPLQRGMVVHSMAAAGSGTFVTQVDLVIDGEVDPGVLRDVWASLQAHHAVLRTAFADVGAGELRQVVVSEAALPWRVLDWSALSAEECAVRLESFLDEQRRSALDPGRPGVFELALVRADARRWHLVWTHHHALLDGWSVAMLLDEMFRLYGQRIDGEPAVPAPRPEYRDYIAWLTARESAPSRAFWGEQLDGFRAPVRLSTDRAVGSRAASPARVEEQELALQEGLTRQLETFAARHRLTLSTVLQGAWALLLSRHSGETDVVFGTATSGRPPDLEGAERMMGLFLNGVPVRLIVEPDASMTDWLAVAQHRLVAIREHEHLALGDIQACSDVPAGQLLFETTVAFENYPVATALDTGAARMGVVDFRLVAPTSSVLHLRIVPGRRMRLMLSHDRMRFDDAVAGEMLRQLEGVLRQLVERPALKVREVSLVTPSISRVLPRDAVSPAIEWTGAAHERVRELAASAGDRPAIRAGGREISYAVLQQRSRSVAAALVAAGVRPGDVVGVHVGRGPALVWTLLGVLDAGAAFTILDPSEPPPRLAERLRLAGAGVLAHDERAEALPEALTSGLVSGPGVPTLVRVDEGALIPAEGAAPGPAATPDQTAYVAFTSGSTGAPKAVRGRHAALSHYGRWLAERFGLGASDRFSMLTALSHDPLLRDVFGPLQVGGTISVPDGEAFERPGALAAWAASEQLTVLNLTPAMARLLLEGGEGTLIPSLRYAMFVGEPLVRPLVDRLRRIAPSATCVNLYGATETQQALAYFVVSPSSDATDPAVIPAGRGMPGVDVLVVGDRGHRAGAGEIGDVWMRSPFLAAGYLGDAELTAARFSEDAFGPGSGRVYRTGDRGYLLPSGDLVLRGRTDAQVKIRGHRIELDEVDALLQQDADVVEAAAAVTTGADGEARLVAFVRGEVEPSELRRRLRRRVPEYLVPASFVRVDRLPRTPAGKVDRRALLEVPLEPAERQAATAPGNPIEAKLLDIWAELLPAAEFGVEDSFFDVGGHSILAARVVSRVREEFSIDLKLSDLFRLPRISQLAPLVAESVAEHDDEVSRLIAEVQALSAEELASVLAKADAPGGEEDVG